MGERYATINSVIADYVIGALVRRARRNTERRIAKGKVRSLWASTPILTLPILARCDRLLGLRSSSLVFNTYYVTRSFDINLILLEGAFRLTRSRKCLGLFRRVVFAWALLRFDIFNYFYDRGLLLSDNRYGINPEELELLWKSGKRLWPPCAAFKVCNGLRGHFVRLRRISLSQRHRADLRKNMHWTT